jgi:hypothetical protein
MLFKRSERCAQGGGWTESRDDAGLGELERVRGVRFISNSRSNAERKQNCEAIRGGRHLGGDVSGREASAGVVRERETV